MNQGAESRTLYVGNLHSEVKEDLIRNIFAQFGDVRSCKIIREPHNDPYAFVEFGEHGQAQNALLSMNKISVFDMELKVNWATYSAGQSNKVDTSKHHHVFVGDLSADIDETMLRQAFSGYGELSETKIIRDPQTLKSKGYGFVAYVKKSDAENAIQNMNGQWLGQRAIRTNWATRKPQSETKTNLDYDQVYNMSSPTNMTVYIGNGLNGLSENIVNERFSCYGEIQEVRVFKEKGYAFVRFASKAAATRAICEQNGEDLQGQTMKCSWGKESNDPPASASGGDMLRGNGMGMQPMQQGQPSAGYGAAANYGGNNSAAGYSPGAAAYGQQQPQQQQQQPQYNQYQWQQWQNYYSMLQQSQQPWAGSQNGGGSDGATPPMVGGGGAAPGSEHSSSAYNSGYPPNYQNYYDSSHSFQDNGRYSQS